MSQNVTTRLVREHDTIVIEDLHVAGMARNRRLTRAISQLGMAQFRRQVEYKAADAGGRVVVADRWYPSSKTCSACGAVKAKLTLAERQLVRRSLWRCGLASARALQPGAGQRVG
ncbi:MAG: RNA-guided endonuclease InsQ/TnpB family protein [Pseudonocardiaceae bacterium]